MLITNLPLI